MRPYRSRNRLVAGGLLTLVALVPSPAGTQASCIPYGDGGAYAPGPPKWFAPSAAGSDRFNTWVDDPRWLGAMSVTYGDGTTNELQFRALHHPQTGSSQYVYLSWWYKAGLNSTAVNNRLYLGLKGSTGSTALLVRVTLPEAAQLTAENPTVRVNPVADDGTLGALISPRPPWTLEIKAWMNDHMDQRTAIPSRPDNPKEEGHWAIHVRIPLGVDLGNGVILESPFHMWYELLQGTPQAPVISYTWPRSTMMESFGVTNSTGSDRVPEVARWPEFRLGSGGAPPCTGVDITPSDIRITHAPGATDDGAIITSGPNTFTATPTNLSGGSIPISDVRARFRIANWGIQPGTLDDADPTTSAWTTIGALGAVQQTPPPDSIAHGEQWTLTGVPWTPTVEDAPGFFNGKSSTHQCVQVELSGPANVDFLRNSAFRNMRIAQASVVTDEAEVSVVGLTPAATPRRDVYLYVQTSNMPRDTSLHDERFGDRLAVPEHPRDRDSLENLTPGQMAELQNPRPEWERRQASEPTYIVRGYYDTGRRITIDGVQRPVLQPMVSFGYFVDHQGALYGWRHALSGAERLAPDFYRVRVPNDSAVKIGVRIEALEQPRSAPLSFGIRAGVAVPHGTFDNEWDPGFAIDADLEYAFARSLAFQLVGGYRSFTGPADSTLSIALLSGNLKLYLGTGGLRPFVNGGAGVYFVDPGDTSYGGNVGAGLVLGISDRLGLEAAYNYYVVKQPVTDPTFSTVEAGLRLRL